MPKRMAKTGGNDLKQRQKARMCYALGFFVILSFLLYGSRLQCGPLSIPSNSGPTAPADRIAAEVAGQAISMDDLERPLAERLYDLEQNIYQLKKQRLDQMIAQIVLQKEADRIGISLQELIDTRVLSTGIEVTPEEIERYLSENPQIRSQWKGSDEDLKNEVANILAQQKGYGKVIDYAASLRNGYNVSIYLKEPAPPRLGTDFSGGVSKGSPDAPVTIVEFSDYECPACRQAHENVRTAQSTYSQQIFWIYKDFPLHRTESSLMAAEAARCADEQGKFSDYQDLLFYCATERSIGVLDGYADALGLDMEAFRSCVDSRKYRERIEKDVQDGRRAGINSTPTYVINGKMVGGALPFEKLKEIIGQELEKTPNAG